MNILRNLSVHPLTLILFAICLVLGSITLYTGHENIAMLLFGIMSGTLAPALIKRDRNIL